MKKYIALWRVGGGPFDLGEWRGQEYDTPERAKADVRMELLITVKGGKRRIEPTNTRRPHE